MRVAVVLLITACTIGNDPPTMVSPARRAEVPSTVLENQDPGADTSRTPVRSRSEARFEDRGQDDRAQLYGCRRLPACTSGDPGGLAIVLAVGAMLRRRQRTAAPRLHAST